MYLRASALVALVIASMAVPSTVFAQRNATAASPNTQQNLLQLGRRQFEDLRYEEAIQTLSAAIIRRGNSRADEIVIYQLLALSYYALQRMDEAEGAFRLVLVRNPDFTLSTDNSPTTVSFYNGVLQRWVAEGRPGLVSSGPQQVTPPVVSPVSIEHRSPAEQQATHPVPLSATVLDPGHRVSRLVLAYRQGDSGLFHRMDAVPSGSIFRATIPGGTVRPPLVEYYFEAVSSTGVPVQSRGDAFAPFRVAVPQGGGVPWWVFAGSAVVIVGVGAAIVGVVLTSARAATLNIQVEGH